MVPGNNVKNLMKAKNTVYREMFAPVLFLCLSPPLSVGSKFLNWANFSSHLNHSGELLLWVGIRHSLLTSFLENYWAMTYQYTAHWLLLYKDVIMQLSSAILLNFIYSMKGLWYANMRSLCRVADTQVTIKAHGPLIWANKVGQISFKLGKITQGKNNPV